ncbi:MAG: twin-arginine translocase TatA/TatE family subunit [Calditrichota bacterium]
MFGIGPPELIVIFLIILILFGAKRLPELAKSLGRSINEFKNASQNIKEELDISKDDNNMPKNEVGKRKKKEEESSKKDDLAG